MLQVTTEWLPPLLPSGSSYSSPNKLLLTALSSECKTEVPGCVNKSSLYQGKPAPSLFEFGACSHAVSIDLKLVRDVRAQCPDDDKGATPGPQTETPQEVSSYFCHRRGNGKNTLLKLILARIRPKNKLQSLLITHLYMKYLTTCIVDLLCVKILLKIKEIQRHIHEWL